MEDDAPTRSFVGDVVPADPSFAETPRDDRPLKVSDEGARQSERVPSRRCADATGARATSQWAAHATDGTSRRIVRVWIRKRRICFLRASIFFRQCDSGVGLRGMDS